MPSTDPAGDGYSGSLIGLDYTDLNMKPYSTDLRQRIVHAVTHEKNTPDQAATRYNISRSTVYNSLQLDQDLNDLSPLKSTGRKRRIPTEQEPLLHAQILEHPDDTLEMHRDRWLEITGDHLSIARMHNSILRLGMTLKKHFPPANATKQPELNSEPSINKHHSKQSSSMSSERT